MSEQSTVPAKKDSEGKSFETASYLASECYVLLRKYSDVLLKCIVLISALRMCSTREVVGVLPMEESFETSL